jgi:quercetin dioxygenase-like cupin family protein
MKRALMLSALLALALPLAALADTTTKAAGTAAGTTAKATETAKAAVGNAMTAHAQKLNEATWEDAVGYPAGVKVAKIHQDATVGCGYLKFPAGTKIAAHTHPSAHYATVLSGSCTFGYGTDTKGSMMGPGDFVYVPAGTPHWLTATTETIVFGAITGPDGITYVNPSDDPRKGQATSAH